jgi:hypothetical protein
LECLRLEGGIGIGFGEDEANRERALCITDLLEAHGVSVWIDRKSIATTRSALGEEDYARIWAEGQAMTLEQAVVYALAESDVRAASSSSPKGNRLICCVRTQRGGSDPTCDKEEDREHAIRGPV